MKRVNTVLHNEVNYPVGVMWSFSVIEFLSRPVVAMYSFPEKHGAVAFGRMSLT